MVDGLGILEVFTEEEEEETFRHTTTACSSGTAPLSSLSSLLCTLKMFFGSDSLQMDLAVRLT